MSHAYRPAATALLLLAGLLLPALATGCNDDIACVFTTGCKGSSGPGPIGTETALLPLAGQWIVPGRPRLTGGFPTGDVAGTTPIVLAFSESLSEDTIDGAFSLVPAAGGPGTSVQAVALGDGRVVVLRPAMALAEGDYTVEVSTLQVPTDLTGETLTNQGEVASFSVVDPAPATPQLVAIWPPAGERSASETGQIVVAFDRPLDPASVDADSFDVRVGLGGATPTDPVPDPLAMPLSVAGIDDPRVYTWRSVDAAGAPVRLGVDAQVQVALSTGTDRLLDEDGSPLASTTVSFRTAPFAAPLDAGLLSMPSDAIGIDNLRAGANELTLQVDLEDGMVGDFVDLIFFGTDPDDATRLVAFERSVQLAGAEPVISATFDRQRIDFSSAGAPRVADGPVAFALRTRRGGVTSPVVVVDADPARPGIQDLLLDTVAPTIVELFAGGPGGEFRSDQRGLVLSGRASELVESAAVTSDVGDNLVSGNPPPVVGADEEGSFVTAPVGNALLPPAPIACSVVVYDRAGNASPAVSGTFTQHGAVGEGGFLPGDTIDVEVFDARTLAPLQGALVVTHADLGNGTDFPFGHAATTGAAGLASVASDAAAGTLLSVERSGYDRFTLQGVPSSRVSVGLWPVGASASARASGDVTTQSSFANLLPVLDVKVADSRLDPADPRTFPTGGCVSLFGLVTCPFPAHDILPERLGVASALVGDFLLGPGSFAPDTLVQAFELLVPRPATASGSTDAYSLELPFFFLESGLDPVEEPIEVPQTLLDAGSLSGLDLMMLEDDPATTGTPHVTLEALVPGVPGSAVVGLGLGFETSSGATSWNVRAAHPGAVTAGYYATNGIVDPDLFLRSELRDVLGNRSVRRPRLSALAGLPSSGGTPLLELPSVPQVALVGTTAGGGGLALDLTLSDVVSDASGLAGMLAVTLVDSTGRAWHLWRADPPDDPAPIALHVPDLAPAGGGRLAAGDVDASARVWAWPGFDAGSFLWSDLEREHDLQATSAPSTITIP